MDMRKGNGEAGGDLSSRRDEGMQRWSPMWPSTRDIFTSPFEMMRRFSDEMDRMFTSMSGTSRDRSGMTVWSPRTEMFERDNQMVVRVELPGMEKNDVRVSVVGDVLVIEGERRQTQTQDQQRGFYRSEWSYGHFHRELPLPESVDPGQVHAKFKNGVLEIELPKPKQTSSRHDVQIES